MVKAGLPAHIALFSSKDSVPDPQREAIPTLTTKGLVEVPAGWLSCLWPSLAGPKSLKEEPGKQEQKLSRRSPVPHAGAEHSPRGPAGWGPPPSHSGRKSLAFLKSAKEGVEQSQRTPGRSVASLAPPTGPKGN